MSAELTIAIPFHRGLDYLDVAIASARAQRAGGVQLLVCDDSDDPAGLRERLATGGGAPLACHHNPQPLGMVRNWNQCIERAETDLVCLLHGDDRLLPDYAEIVLELAARHPRAAALFCAARIIDARGRRHFSTADAIKRWYVPRGAGEFALRGEAGLCSIMAGNFIMCPTLCLRKSALAGRRFSERWAQVQDLEFTSRLLMEGELLVGSRRVGYAYRRHPENATARQSESFLRFEEEFRLFGLVADRAEQMGWTRAARVSRRRTIVKLHLGFRALRDLARARPRKAWAALRFLAQRRAQLKSGEPGA